MLLSERRLVGGPLLYDRACAACARCIDWSISACMDPVGVTLKCLPHEKSARGKIITDFICHPLIKLSTAPSTVSPFSARPFPRKSLFPGQQFIDKNPSRPSGRRAEQIFVSKLSAGEIFLGRGAILYWDTGRCNTGHWLLTYWSGIQSQPPAGLSVCLSLSLSLCFSVCLHKSDPTHAFLSPRRNTLPWGWNVCFKEWDYYRCWQRTSNLLRHKLLSFIPSLRWHKRHCGKLSVRKPPFDKTPLQQNASATWNLFFNKRPYSDCRKPLQRNPLHQYICCDKTHLGQAACDKSLAT